MGAPRHPGPGGRRPPARRSRAWLVAAPLAALALVLGGAVADAQPAPTVTVNGTPIDEEASPQDTCTLEVEVAGLPVDAATQVRTAVVGIPPSVPEGTELGLVDETATATGPTWATSIPVAPHLDQLSHHGNGHRVRLDVWLDGQPAGSQRSWLRCDDERPRHPTRMLFELHWLTHEGQPVAEPLDDLLPEGWRAVLRLDASSDKGTAVCTYPPGSDVLTCAYDNPGHEDAPGLVVPARPTATYEVAVSGLPDGATADAAALGTFVGRDECPRGHDGHGGGGGGHDPGHVAVTDVHDEEPVVCTHAVDVTLPTPPPPTTTTTTSATTVPPPTTSPAGVAGAGAPASPTQGGGDGSPASGARPATSSPASGALPATGSADGPLALVAVALVALGATLLRLRSSVVGRGAAAASAAAGRRR